MPNVIERTINARIKEQNTIFVFPTQTAADLWADRATLTSDVSAVAMERFIAWDRFKGAAVRGKQQRKKSIPAALRSMFASLVIEENAREPFFEFLISREYASSARSFSKWIASLLPSLEQWKTLFDKSRRDADSEDKDLLALRERYIKFLDERGLFEPAWEKPPLDTKGSKYVLFFPEILEDYSEYCDILSSSEDITLVSFDEEDAKHPDALFYSNSRTELREAALYIRELREKNGINYENIAVSVFDIETYAPYIEREFSIYQIPYILRNGAPLSSTGAGNLFSLIKNCVAEDFSFASVKALLLNNHLPWKAFEINRRLIDFGKENNCLCSYEYEGEKVDVWIESLRANPREHRLEEFYVPLKTYATRLAQSKSFSDINRHYFDFREKFFNMDECSESANTVISRCIAELGELIDIERDFPDCAPKDPFGFFVDYLGEKMYLAQSSDRGVHVLPYKLAAVAPYSCQIVIDSTQKSLAVIYKKLGFLRDDKRAALGLSDDPNVSDIFIKLYAMNSIREAARFTAAEKTFTGYGLCHGFLEEQDARDNNSDKFNKYDTYTNENKWMRDEKSQFPSALTSAAQKGFMFWSSNQMNLNENPEEICPNKHILDKNSEGIYSNKYISNNIWENISRDSRGRLKISYSALNKFYLCPRSYLFERILKISPQNNEAELMDPFAMGNLYHAILQKYCEALKISARALSLDKNGALTCENENDYGCILKKSVEDAIKESRGSQLSKQLLCAARDAIQEKMEQVVIHFTKTFDGCVVKETEKEYSFYPDDSDGKNYFYNGRIDCLLADREGSMILVDFKASKRAVHSEKFYVTDEVKTPDFQMPMYSFLLDKNNVHLDSCAFYDLGEYKPYYVFGDNADENADVISTMKAFHDCVEKFSERIEARDFSVDSEIQTFDVCNECVYRAVCRRVFTVSKGE